MLRVFREEIVIREALFAWVSLAMTPFCAPSQIVHDSAGIRIVDYGGRRTAPRIWPLERRPILSVGGSDAAGATEFSDVRGVALLAGGYVAVANGGTGEIRILSPRGEFIRSHGRAGPGPGEFTRLHGLFRLADTLFGIDGDGRAQAFVAQGDFARSLVPLRVSGARSTQRIGFLASGKMLVTMLEDPPTSRDEKHEVTLAVALSEADGDNAVPILRLKAHDVHKFPSGSAKRLLDASGIVTANGERVCGGFSDRFDLTCYDQSGKPVLRIRRTVRRESLTDEDRDLVRAAYLAANRNAPEAVRRQMERAALEFPFAALRPVYSRLVLSASGELWVAPFDATHGPPGPPAGRSPKSSMRWSVFSRDGEWLADVELPKRFVVMEIGPDHVAGVNFDDDDVEQVAVLKFRR